MRESKGHSPLGLAVKHCQTDVEDYLLEQGCIMKDQEKSQLLCEACQEKQLKVIKKMVKAYKCPLKGKPLIDPQIFI